MARGVPGYKRKFALEAAAALPVVSPPPVETPDAEALDAPAARGKAVAEAAARTIATGEAMRSYWCDLEPIVKLLIGDVKTRINDPLQMKVLSPTAAANLLHAIASVVDKMSKAAAGMHKSGEMLSRLAIKYEGGIPERKSAKTMSERQLANVVIEACRRMKLETGVCPVCASATIDVTPESAPA